MIGKKIYYELETGNVVLTIPERHNENAVETTKEQDFIMFDVLQARNPSLIGIKQMGYREFQNDFNIANSFMIDIMNGNVLFQYPNSVIPQSESIENLKSENGSLGMLMVEKDTQIMGLQNGNEALGNQIVQMDIRLMMGGM